MLTIKNQKTRKASCVAVYNVTLVTSVTRKAAFEISGERRMCWFVGRDKYAKWQGVVRLKRRDGVNSVSHCCVVVLIADVIAHNDNKSVRSSARRTDDC